MKRSGPGVPAALALAIAIMPTDAAAQGFWQMPRAGERASGLPVVERASVTLSGDEKEGRSRFTGSPSAIFRLPGTDSRLGIAVIQKAGRPSFDGLAFQAAPNIRISANGDFDFEERSLSGQVKLQFDF